MANPFLVTAGFWIFIGVIIISAGKAKSHRHILIASSVACVACIIGGLTPSSAIAISPEIAALVDPYILVYSLVMVLLGLALAFLLRSFQAEKNLGLSQNRFQNMLLSANEGILEIDDKGQCRFCNLAGAQILGLRTPDHVIGRDFRTVFYFSQMVDSNPYRDYNTEPLGPISTAITQRHCVDDGEDILSKNDGSSFPVRFSVSPLMRNGTFTGVVVTLMDITKQKSIQQELEEKERNFRGLIQHAPRGIFIHNQEGLLFANQSLAAMFGYRNVKDILDHNGLNAFLPPHLSAVFWDNEMRRLNGENTSVSYEVTGRHRDGTPIYLEHNGQQITWHGKAAIHSTLTDITEAKKAATLKEKTTRVLRMATQAAEVILSATEEGPMLEKVCETIVKSGKYKAAWVAEQQHNQQQDQSINQNNPEKVQNQTFKLTGCRGLGKKLRQSWERYWNRCDHRKNLLHQVITRGKPLVITDIADNPDYQKLRLEASKANYNGICLLPMRSKNHITSVLAVCSAQDEGFLDEEVELILTLANNLATHLQNLRARQELSQAMKALRLHKRALEATSDGLLITDATEKDWPIVYANPAFTRITGFTAEDILGRNPRFLHANESSQDGLNAIRKALRTNQTGRAVLRNYRHDGSMFWNELTISPVADRDGAITHYVGVQRDISELKKTESLLRKSMEEAEYANRTKTDFLANMSHETRTPLNAILAFSETIKREVFGPINNPKYREYIEDIHESGKHLLAILDDILDVSRIENGQYILHEEKFSLTTAINAALRILKNRVTEKSIDLVVDLPDPGPWIRADERSIKQIVINLVSNAVKFTPENGRIDVALTIEKPDHLILTVRDNGIGIAAADLMRVTQPFVQGENVEVRKHHGAGLGLSLVQNLTTLHDGHFIIESDEGKGVEASVLLPYKRVTQPPRLTLPIAIKTEKKPKKISRKKTPGKKNPSGQKSSLKNSQ